MFFVLDFHSCFSKDDSWKGMNLDFDINLCIFSHRISPVYNDSAPFLFFDDLVGVVLSAIVRL